MEIISLSRVLPEKLVQQIQTHVEKWTNGQDYTLILGRAIINAEIINKEHIFKIVVSAVCDYYSVPQAMVLSKTRKKPYVEYRQIVAYFLDRYYHINQKEIANMIGLEERSTVSYSSGHIKNLIQSDKNVAFDIRNLNTIITEAVGPV